MAVIAELDEVVWREWLATRPEIVQEMAAKYPPNKLYRINSGHRVTLLSYCEDGTVSVNVSGQYNAVVFDRNVFGVPAVELVECDLPGDDEPCGVMLTEEADIQAHCEAFRESHECDDPECRICAAMENR